MPAIPIVLPLIVVGVTVGSLLRSNDRKISRRRILVASLIGGLLNAGQAAAVYALTSPRQTGIGPPGTAGGQAAARFLAQAPSQAEFIASSLIAGALIVFAVLGIAIVYVKLRGGREEVGEEAGEEPQTESEPLTQEDSKNEPV